MDKILKNLIEEKTAKVNPLIGNGLACYSGKFVEQTIDERLKETSKGYPPGLKYLGYERCTPLEEFTEKSKKRVAHREYDIAHSDVYMIKLYFSFNDEPLPVKFIYLPFFEEAGSIMIGGNRWFDTPVIFDRAITPGENSIFVRIHKGRLTFKRFQYPFLRNEILSTAQIVYGLLYNKNAKQKLVKPLVRANTAVGHYLFCRYGVTQTFKKFANTDIKIVDLTTIGINDYPEEQYVIYRSTQIPPKSFRNKDLYKGTNLAIIVKKEEDSITAFNLAAAFFYVIDLFVDYFELAFIDNQDLWLVILGHILLSGSYNQGKLYEDMSAHLKSLNEYLDMGDVETLRNLGEDVEDFYDLIANLMVTYSDRVVKDAKQINSFYKKELNILYYLLYEITSNIVLMYFKLMKLTGTKNLNINTINTIMKEHLSVGMWFKVTRNNGEFNSISYSNDNKLGITTNLTPQRKVARSGQKSSRWNVNDPTKKLDTSLALVCQFSTASKAEPDGRSKLNPFLKLTNKLTIAVNKELKPLLKQTDEEIRK